MTKEVEHAQRPWKLLRAMRAEQQATRCGDCRTLLAGPTELSGCCLMPDDEGDVIEILSAVFDRVWREGDELVVATGGSSGLVAVFSPGPPPALRLVLDGHTPELRDRVAAPLAAATSAAMSRLAEEGTDALCDALLCAAGEVDDALAGAQAAARAAGSDAGRARPTASSAAIACSEREIMRAVVVAVDHMNDARRYTQALESLCAGEGASGIVLGVAMGEARAGSCTGGGDASLVADWPVPSAAALPASLGHCRRGSHEALLVALRGPAACVGSVLRRWRAEPVDCNSRGRPCVERKLRVVADTHLAVEGVPAPAGSMAAPPLRVRAPASPDDVAATAAWLGIEACACADWMAAAARGVKLR